MSVPRIEWRSKDPRTSQIVAYSASDNDAIEQSFQRNRQGKHQLCLGGNIFTIDFAIMTQFNATGGSRPVYRHTLRDVDVQLEGTTKEKISSVIGRIDPTTIALAAQAIAEHDGMCDYILENISMFSHMYLSSSEKKNAVPLSDVVASCNIQTESMIDLFNVILQLFVVDDLSCSDVTHHVTDDFSKPNAHSEHMDLIGLQAGDPVPAYFANVRGEGIFRRKYLSLLGLRNLTQCGTQIFSELFETLFSSDPSMYSGSVGINKMKFMTGNVVDLDTVVLNCTLQLKSVNELRAKESPTKAPFKSAQEFFASPDATLIARHQAEPVISAFVDALKLTPTVVMSRKLDIKSHPAGSPFPTATSNYERGQWPVWGYANVGVFTYHANVPHLADVVGSLLRSPFHIVKAFLMCLSESKIIPESHLDTKSLLITDETINAFLKHIKAFFERAVNDSCFNAKWKAIEAFIDEMTSMESIATVIGNLQASRQDIFTKKLFDEDDDARTNETAALAKLITEGGIKGRDPATNKIRLLCKQDVEVWIKATM